MEAEKNSQAIGHIQPTQPEEKKVKISYEEYQRISTLVVASLKNFETQGQESAQQSEIINDVVAKLTRTD